MKFTIASKSLLSHLSAVSKVVSQKTQLPYWTTSFLR